MTTTVETATPRLAYRVERAAEALSISRSALYELIRSRQIRSFTIGRTRLISHSALTDYLDEQDGRLR
ncbi:MAG: helix-turn-helix domain-containing protein [Nocardioides sp.]